MDKIENLKEIEKIQLQMEKVALHYPRLALVYAVELFFLWLKREWRAKE